MKTFKQFILEGKKKKEQKAALETLTGQIDDKMAQKEANKPFAGPVEFGVGTKPNSRKRKKEIERMINDYGVPELKKRIRERQKEARREAKKQLGL